MVSLLALTIADPPEVWARLGFAVTDGRACVGTVEFLLAGAESGRGATGWTLGGDPSGPADIDGLPTTWAPTHAATPSGTHANGVQRIDHLVVMTPDVERTVAACGRIGLDVRRRREGEAYGRPMRQAFFWLGDPGGDGVILEVVGPPTVDPATAGDPATIFGVAFTVADLATTGTFFGDLMKPPVDAVQPGRQITTLSSKCGATFPIALMSPHV
jgi:hypothetical protein